MVRGTEPISWPKLSALAVTQTIRAFASLAQAFSWLVCARIARLLL
jgi:hypothetical protein